jgi:hypothetical protein
MRVSTAVASSSLLFDRDTKKRLSDGYDERLGSGSLITGCPTTRQSFLQVGGHCCKVSVSGNFLPTYRNPCRAMPDSLRFLLIMLCLAGAGYGAVWWLSAAPPDQQEIIKRLPHAVFEN